MSKDRRGNPYRCRTCGNLAGKDSLCKRHRRDVFPSETLPEIKRKNYMEYGQYFGKAGFFASQYGVVRDKYLMERDHGET